MRDSSFKDFILDQLNEHKDLGCRSMFGGYGLYRGSRFFGIIFKDRLYFKVDDQSKKEYVQFKMRPFRPNPEQTLKSFYQVPDEIIDSRQDILIWALKAQNAAVPK